MQSSKIKKGKNLTERLYEEELFLTDGYVAYRTEPPMQEGRNFRLFVKTEKDEVELSPETNHFNRILSGEEIQEEISPEGYYHFTQPDIIF